MRNPRGIHEKSDSLGKKARNHTLSSDCGSSVDGEGTKNRNPTDNMIIFGFTNYYWEFIKGYADNT